MKNYTLLFFLLLFQANYSQTGESHFNEGKKLYDAKSYTEAIKQFDSAISLKYANAELYIVKANSSYFLDDKKAAFENYTKAIETDPKSARAYYNRGILYKGDGQYEQAMSDFNSSLNADANYSSALLERGKLYYAVQSDYQKAINDLEKYVNTNPKDDEAYAMLGVCTGKLNSNPKTIAKSIEYFSKAIELNTKESDYYYYRGYAFIDKGDNKKALSDMNKAIELNPKNELAYFERGNIHFDAKDYAKQITDYDKAIALNSKSGKYFYWRGYAKFFGLKDKDLACPDFFKAIELGYKKAEEMKSICNTKGRTIIVTE